MAAERKLKAEIDRTLKKVLEGQEVFDDLWNQVRPASCVLPWRGWACSHAAQGRREIFLSTLQLGVWA